MMDTVFMESYCLDISSVVELGDRALSGMWLENDPAIDLYVLFWLESERKER